MRHRGLAGTGEPLDCSSVGLDSPTAGDFTGGGREPASGRARDAGSSAQPPCTFSLGETVKEADDVRAAVKELNIALYKAHQQRIDVVIFDYLRYPDHGTLANRLTVTMTKNL
jgi:hypothetical protein